MTSLRRVDIQAEVFDLTGALSRVNDDHALLVHFLHLFRDRNSHVVADIGVALSVQNLELARRLAHALKGGAGTVGLVSVQAAADQLEAALGHTSHSLKDLAHRTECLIALEAAWAQAQDAMQSLLDVPNAWANVAATPTIGSKPC